jgi:diguanylate cyclase (GGDEF)-like protein/PAS domain S-box-containing protein
MRWIFILVLALQMPFFLMADSSEAENAAKPPHILILNSYHKGYNWTDEQSEAMLAGFREQLPNATEDVVYMDWKRNPRQETLTDLYQTLQNRYQSNKVDLILTTDDIALSFALQHRKAIFSNAPVVFSGIFESSDKSLTGGQKGVTGVYETVNPEGTIALAMKLFPKSRNIYIIHDESETSVTMESDINAILDKMGLPLSRHVLSGMPFEELKKKLSELPKDGFALFASYGRDSDGLVLQPEEFARQMSETSTVPLFVLYTHMMGTGAFGGSLLDGHLQGEAAVGLGVEILRGTPAESLPRIKTKTVSTVVDYNSMSRFGISRWNIPAGSRIMNKPFSFLEAYRELVLLSAIAVLLLVSLVVGLFVNIQVKKRVQQELIKSHGELSASEEELRAQCESLLEREAELRRSETRYRLVSEAAQDVIWDWDMRTDERLFPERLYEMLGYPLGSIRTEEQWQELQHPEDRLCVRDALRDHLEGASPVYKAEFRVRREDQEYIWLRASGKAIFDAGGMPVEMVGAYTDITEEERQKKRLDRLAYYDSLTGLPNRIKLREDVTRIILDIREENGTLCLMFIDMDNFKYVNDSFGHNEGDELLKQIACRIQGFLPEDGYISRLGGDEFVIVLTGAMSEARAVNIADELQESIREPYYILGNQFFITFSMGIVLYPRDGADFDNLLKNADTAMYSSKETGKSKYTFFSEDMNQSVVKRMRLYSQLRNAMDRKEFELYYQPQIHVKTSEIRGFEALIRWNNPVEGLVSPAKFIQACEETGLIVPLGLWVLETACLKAKDFIASGLEDMIMSVNISVVQLIQGNFTESIREILRKTGLDPSHLELEVTESILIESIDMHIEKLRELKKIGIHIALDDFGSGYSSLNYLRRLPLNVLKIDKSFIDFIHTDTESEGLVATIIDIAGNMGLEVIAEGVELQEQRDLLVSRGCSWMQGYLVAKPLPAAQIETFLREHNKASGADMIEQDDMG